jgi:hypothetical protein
MIYIYPGRRFGYLTAVRQLTLDELLDRYRTRKNSAWWCRCVCGARVSVRRPDLVGGGTRSCGCKAWEMHLETRALTL